MSEKGGINVPAYITVMFALLHLFPLCHRILLMLCKSHIHYIAQTKSLSFFLLLIKLTFNSYLELELIKGNIFLFIYFALHGIFIQIYNIFHFVLFCFALLFSWNSRFKLMLNEGQQKY